MNQNSFSKSSVQFDSSILLTIDVEDWFQVENFKQYIPFSSWPSCELRVEKNTHTILDFLDEFSSNSNLNAKTNKSIKATFFILGWIAERIPGLVKEIYTRGHEVASHGYNHELYKEFTYSTIDSIKSDLTKSRKLLEDMIGDQVFGYRAPSFSITHDLLKVIEESGYLYDSSYNSFSIHRRYGHIDLTQHPKTGISKRLSENFYELPISNLNFGNIVMPWGGGGYFRLIPFFLFSPGIKVILKKDNGYLFYMHPWEIDPEQPRVKEASFWYKFRHYSNLEKTLNKLSNLLYGFNECCFISCYKYLKVLGVD